MKTFKVLLTFVAVSLLLASPFIPTWAAKKQPLPGPGETPHKATKPDLTIQGPAIYPANPTTDDNITFNAKIINIGDETAASSKGGIRVGGESKPVLYPHTSLIPNQSVTISRSLKIERPGKYIVRFIADAGKEIAESNETNNEAQLQFTVRKLKADLIVRNPKIKPANPTVNDQIHLSAELLNIGQVPSNPTKCGVKVGGETNPNLGYYGAIPVDSPQAQKYAVARSIKITKPGNYIATFIADANNDCDELSENNNTVQLHFTVK